jgi:alpha-1,2-mannosyltransferase
LNVFARAGWAARTGADLYDISDDNGFHYLYLPTFAILFSPLADAPEGAPRDGLLPYGVTVLYWYFFNVICLALSAHWLACTLEQSSPVWSSPEWRGSRGWWALRLWPMLACLPPIGHTLIRGQVGMLLLLFMSGMIWAVVRRKNAQAGLWLACAICLKVIPALLLVYPLLRRDARFLGGCAAGLLVGLVAIPVAARGPQQTWLDYQKWNQVMLAPALANGSDTSRANEVLNVTATDSQSFLAMIHNTRFLDRETRPSKAAPATRWLARLASGLLLLVVLAAACRCRPSDDIAAIIVWGALIEVMLLGSPVCHLHYFCLSVPLVAGLVGARWHNQSRPALSAPLALLVALNLFANVVPLVPGMEVARDMGLAGYAAIGLVATAVVVVWRREYPTHPAGDLQSPRAAA